MEDFLYNKTSTLSEEENKKGHEPSSDWQPLTRQSDNENDPEFLQKAEARVHARQKLLRINRNFCQHMTPLRDSERIARLKALLTYWNSGCIHVIDEQLFADVARRAQKQESN